MKQYLNFNHRNVSDYSLRYHFGQIFKKIELSLFILLSIIFLTLSKVNKNINTDVSFIFVDLSLPIVKIIAFPFNATLNLLINFQELIDAKKENESLRLENEKLRNLYVTALNINNENQELKNLLRFIIPKSLNYNVAKIVGRSNGLFNQNIFLNAGLDRNLQEGSVVAGAVGMIGRVIEVEKDKSRLMLVTDSNSRIPIIASKARARGVLVGNNSNLMEIFYLSKNHQIQIGDLIFTSGDGDTLPPGILIGVVRKVSKSYVGVEMVEDINNSDIVTIINY